MKKKTELLDCYRHGDVDLIPVKLPDDCEVAKTGDLTVAEGEATGHHHTIYPPAGVIATMLLKGERKFIALTKDAPIRHQEHDTRTIKALDKGYGYEIKIEREEDPFEDEIRQVQD